MPLDEPRLGVLSRALVVASLLLGSAGTAAAQYGFCVQVTEGESVAIGITVEVRDSAGRVLTGMTGATGEACFRGLAAGSYEVSAIRSGFQSKVEQVTVGPGQTLVVRIELPTYVDEPITVTGSSDREVASAGPAWNTWAQDAEEEPADPAVRLSVGGQYDFYLELSRLADTRIGVLAVTPEQRFIDQLRAKFLDGKTKVDLIARPTVIGRAVSLQTSQVPAHWSQDEWSEAAGGGRIDFEVRLAPLFEPRREPFGRSQPSDADRDAARAGGIRFRVRAERRGCAAIAVSIWDGAHDRLIDQVVHVLTVGDAVCYTRRASQVARRSLLDLLEERELESRLGTLNVFEVDPGGPRGERTVFEYVSAEPSAPCDRFEWERPVLLTRDLLDNPHFSGLLYSARTQDLLGYAKAALYLRKKLFPTRDDDACGGRAALSAIQAHSDQRRRAIEVRSVDLDNNDVFLPLNLLLALRDEGLREPFFSQPPRLLQRLPLQTFGAGTRCIRDWTFVLPSKLVAGSPEIALPAPVARYVGEAPKRSLEDLLEFLDRMAERDEDDASPVGLVVLSHHHAGVLRDAVTSLDLDWTDFSEVRVPEGSVAVFSACAVGDLARSPALVATLSKIGFDAIIVSPFPVAESFGAAVATRFSELVVEARATAGTTRVGDLFDEAAAWAASELSVATGSRSAGMPLEFVFAGDSEVAVCGREAVTDAD
jgi:hypothetical protein